MIEYEIKYTTPATATCSEMCRFSFARLSNEAATTESSLSMYSHSGLFIESLVDIDEIEESGKLGDIRALGPRQSATAGFDRLLAGDKLWLLDNVVSVLAAEVTGDRRWVIVS